MSRKLPLCALCGARLAYQDKVLVRFNIKGQPEAGWCIKCGPKDPISPFGDDDPFEDDRPALIKRIEARGAGRIVWGK